jgi:hypothetical protein
MTTLRIFQTEIDDIHNREAAKQRTLASKFPEKESHDQRNASAAKGKARDDSSGPTPKVTTLTKGGNATRASLIELEDRIMV